jgi:L-ascorbate metabolism protein UlaG (beta-lactamase superfamily)
VVTDPYGVKNEYYFVPFPELHADVVTISHRHNDHMGGMYEVTDYSLIVYPEKFKEKFTAGSVEITGYPSEHVHNLGSNTVFIYKSGDFKIVNMAETDLISDKDALEEAKGADVLLMYAGEYGDVKNEEILSFAKEMCIPVIIPEHYSMQPDNMFYGHVPLSTVLSEIPEDLPIVGTDQLYVTKGMDRQFVVLDPWQDNLK